MYSLEDLPVKKSASNLLRQPAKLGILEMFVKPLMSTLKLHSNVLLYSNTVIGTLAVDGWAVTFGTARRGLGGLGPRPFPSSLYQM